MSEKALGATVLFLLRGLTARPHLSSQRIFTSTPCQPDRIRLDFRFSPGSQLG